MTNLWSVFATFILKWVIVAFFFCKKITADAKSQNDLFIHFLLDWIFPSRNRGIIQLQNSFFLLWKQKVKEKNSVSQKIKTKDQLRSILLFKKTKKSSRKTVEIAVTDYDCASERIFCITQLCRKLKANRLICLRKERNLFHPGFVLFSLSSNIQVLKRCNPRKRSFGKELPLLLKLHSQTGRKSYFFNSKKSDFWICNSGNVGQSSLSFSSSTTDNEMVKTNT